MKALEEIWENIWGEKIPDGESHKRSFRLVKDILDKINKSEDEDFILEALSTSRSLNIIIKKLYFEFAPIEKEEMESPDLVDPKKLPEIDVKQSPEFKQEIDKEYLYAMENQELNDRICKNCGGKNNTIDDFDRYDNPIIVCVEDGCNQQYRYDRETKFALKVPIHWIGLKNEVYDSKKGNFENWVLNRVDPFTKTTNLEPVQYDENGKRVNYYWGNLDERSETNEKTNKTNSSDIDVFNKGGHWYYWVNGFKTFRFHQKHSDRNFDDEYGCPCGICKMDL
jgi:hypothetical protein